MPAQSAREIDSLVARRRQIVDMITAEKLRLGSPPWRGWRPSPGNPVSGAAGQWRGKSFIGGGRKSIRCALFVSGLFVSALTAKRHNKAFKAFFDTLLKAGKPKMVAMIAVARKLLTQINAMIRDNAPWTEQMT